MAPQQHLDHAHVDVALQEMRGERVPQRMRRDPAAEPGGFGRHVAGAIELPRRHGQQWVAPGEQPAPRPALPPPRSQQLQQLWRQQGMPILAALAHLDTDQHALGIDIAEAQHDHLGTAQTGAVGDAERGLVLEAGSGRSLEQPGDLIGREHPWQLARIVRARKLVGKVGAAQCDSEEEAQRRRLRIHLRRLCALLDLGKLEAANVVAGRGVGRAAEKPGKGLDMPDIVVLRLVAEAPHGHVRDHAAAKIADRLVTHRETPVLRLSAGPSILRTGRSPVIAYRSVG